MVSSRDRRSQGPGSGQVTDSADTYVTTSDATGPYGPAMENTAGLKTVSMGIENGRVFGHRKCQGPAIPVSPTGGETCGLSERETGPGRVSGVLCLCQGPGDRSLPPAKARGIRGQDTVERHAGLDPVMEKDRPMGAGKPGQPTAAE